MLKSNDLLKSCLISLGITWVASAVLLLLSAAVCLCTDDPMNCVWIGRTVFSLSGAICGFVCGRSVGKRGLICGIACGGLYVLTAFIPSFIMGTSKGFAIPALLCILICVVFACIGAGAKGSSNGKLPTYKKSKKTVYFTNGFNNKKPKG